MVNIKNTEDLSQLDEELKKRKALPIGKTEFDEWSDRIIKGAMIEADPLSLKFALASMLMHLGPTEAFREDGYFILALRKGAVNQTAHAIMTEIKDAQKKQAEATAPIKLEAVNDVSVLAEQGL